MSGGEQYQAPTRGYSFWFCFPSEGNEFDCLCPGACCAVCIWLRMGAVAIIAWGIATKLNYTCQNRGGKNHKRMALVTTTGLCRYSALLFLCCFVWNPLSLHCLREIFVFCFPDRSSKSASNPRGIMHSFIWHDHSSLDVRGWILCCVVWTSVRHLHQPV